MNYILNTPASAVAQGIPKDRIAVGIALPIVYFALVIPMASAYLRLLIVVATDPGLTEQRTPPQECAKPAGAPEDYENDRTLSTRSCAPTTIAEDQEPVHLAYEDILKGKVLAPPGIEEYYTKDVFVCDGNGLPLWCPTCCNWKPDRSHHCSDIGRCVLKMDHFCPWVGGVVGENGFKFFSQFTAYASWYCAYTLAVMGYFVGESEARRGTIANVHFVVVIGLAGFFLLFTFGLNLMGFHMTLLNRTTIENIDAASTTMFLAVLLPPELQHQQRPQFPPPAYHTRTATPPSRSNESEAPLTSELDDPSHATYFSNSRVSRKRSRSKSHEDIASDPASRFWQGTITYPLYTPSDRPPSPAPEPRTFAILRTPPGLNPWNLGAYYNLQSVFGLRPHDWVLPIKLSPCTNHNTSISFYAMGWEFEQLLHDARLVQPPEFIKKARRRGSSVHKRKRKRRLDDGWQNGERPDGWDAEKEARRVRRMQREMEGRGRPSR